MDSSQWRRRPSSWQATHAVANGGYVTSFGGHALAPGAIVQTDGYGNPYVHMPMPTHQLQQLTPPQQAHPTGNQHPSLQPPPLQQQQPPPAHTTPRANLPPQQPPNTARQTHQQPVACQPPDRCIPGLRHSTLCATLRPGHRHVELTTRQSADNPTPQRPTTDSRGTRTAHRPSSAAAGRRHVSPEPRRHEARRTAASTAQHARLHGDSTGQGDARRKVHDAIDARAQYRATASVDRPPPEAPPTVQPPPELAGSVAAQALTQHRPSQPLTTNMSRARDNRTQDPPQAAQAAAAAPAQAEPAQPQGGQRSTSTDDNTRDDRPRKSEGHGSQRVENKAMKYVYKQHKQVGEPPTATSAAAPRRPRLGTPLPTTASTSNSNPWHHYKQPDTHHRREGRKPATRPPQRDAKPTPPIGTPDHQPQRQLAHTNLVPQTLLPMTSQPTQPAVPHVIPRQQTRRSQKLRPQPTDRAEPKARLPIQHTTTQHSNLHRG